MGKAAPAAVPCRAACCASSSGRCRHARTDPRMRALVTDAPDVRTPLAALGPAQAIRAFPYAAFTLVIAVMAACGARIAAMPSSWADAADVPFIQEDARA